MNIKFILFGSLILLSVFAVRAFAATKNRTNAQLVQTVAPAFSYPEIVSGENMGPSNFKGSYLLIDFWASWCPPCNAAVPHLKALYEKHEGKNFEILGVSIDKDKEKWAQSVEHKKLPWKNVWTDDAGSKVSSLYNFSSIPHFVLLDKEGKIIASGFSIRELDSLLKNNVK